MCYEKSVSTFNSTEWQNGVAFYNYISISASSASDIYGYIHWYFNSFDEMVKWAYYFWIALL